MANLFDPDLAQEGEPKTVVVGDFIQWKRSDLASDYPLATHSAELVARIKGTKPGAEIKVSATESDSIYLFTIQSSASAGYLPGEYYWQLEITETATSNRVVVDRGEFEIKPDLDDHEADPRSHAEKMVAKIESLLEGKADSDVSYYMINGRALTKMSYKELVEARNYYKAEANRLKTIENMRNGKSNGSTIKVRF
jgi:hypothetical protein